MTARENPGYVEGTKSNPLSIAQAALVRDVRGELEDMDISALMEDDGDFIEASQQVA